MTWKSFELHTTMSDMLKKNAWQQYQWKPVESLLADPVGHWCLRWCPSCLLLCRCGLWTPLMTLPLFLCVPARVLCSLAEDEVKTEADVVEGMDASVRSKGKPQRPGKPAITMPSFLWQRKVEVGSCKLRAVSCIFFVAFRGPLCLAACLVRFSVYVYMVLTECFFLSVITKF